MTKSLSLPRRRLTRQQRRLELLEAGERVVRQMGNAARVEDVVHAANASKGTFYVYFDTWDDFLIALRDRASKQLESRFEAFQQECGDCVEFIGGLPALFIDLTLSLEGLHAAVFHGPVAQVAPTNPRADVMVRLRKVIAEGSEAKALQAPDIATTTRLAFGVLHEAADLVEGGEDRKVVSPALRTLLLNALRVRQVPFRK